MDGHKRKHQRLPVHDYSRGGYYFITICTYGRRPLFGVIHNGKMDLSPMGHIAGQELLRIPGRFVAAGIDAFTVMPNHVHFILTVEEDPERSRPFPTVSTMVGQYKAGVSRLIHGVWPDVRIWQKSFHDHIIRNETDYLNIHQYIAQNPMKWHLDQYYDTNQSERKG